MTGRVEHASGGSDDWTTPPKVLEAVRLLDPKGSIGLDPCSCSGNPTAARVYFTPEKDGLHQIWTNGGIVFANPPYGQIKRWTAKAIAESQAGAEIVLLTAARPGARWYRDAQQAAAGYCEIQGRLRFGNAEHSAPFPSSAFYFGDRFQAFYEAFRPLGFVTMSMGRMGLLQPEEGGIDVPSA